MSDPTRSELALASRVVHHPAAKVPMRPDAAPISWLSDRQLRQAGIPLGLIRLFVGIEDPQDLIQELYRTLNQFG